ncbi:hypothetical protein P280DRAFT_516524 [Massarina eburnea CBS 473.64]|uniref:Uncharacterized protein n=1 Tax=Massarina eburnea CBS 473.64 TaxID=1395130 RepID=A0A6A6S675_9PLEO|nr:hypothetical protein P280DRAFT_516524 [Massarina eburnea CBS 473.64]
MPPIIPLCKFNRKSHEQSTAGPSAPTNFLASSAMVSEPIVEELPKLPSPKDTALSPRTPFAFVHENAKVDSIFEFRNLSEDGDPQEQYSESGNGSGMGQAEGSGTQQDRADCAAAVEEDPPVDPADKDNDVPYSPTVLEDTRPLAYGPTIQDLHDELRIILEAHQSGDANKFRYILNSFIKTAELYNEENPINNKRFPGLVASIAPPNMLDFLSAQLGEMQGSYNLTNHIQAEAVPHAKVVEQRLSDLDQRLIEVDTKIHELYVLVRDSVAKLVSTSRSASSLPHTPRQIFDLTGSRKTPVKPPGSASSMPTASAKGKDPNTRGSSRGGSGA